MAVQPVGRRVSVKWPTCSPGTSVSDPAADSGRGGVCTAAYAVAAATRSRKSRRDSEGVCMRVMVCRIARRPIEMLDAMMPGLNGCGHDLELARRRPPNVPQLQEARRGGHRTG